MIDVVHELLNSDAVDMLKTTDLGRVEGASGSIGRTVPQEVHPGPEPLDVRCREDGPATGLQDPEDL